MNRESASPIEEEHQDGLPIPRRYWSAAAIWLALSMAVLDGSIANVALPTIAHDLGASPATSVWIVNAYQLTITILLLPLAAYGDRCGYRGIYLPGLVLFTLGSLGCAMAHSLATLIAARVFQGVGAACIMSMNAALVRATYPAKMLGRGIGYQRAGAVDGGGGRSDARGTDLECRLLAVAVPDQLADRCRRRDRRLEGAAARARPRQSVRLGRGLVEWRDDGLRTSFGAETFARCKRNAWCGADRRGDRGRVRCWCGANGATPRPVPRRSAQIRDLQHVDRHFDRFVRGADARPICDLAPGCPPGVGAGRSAFQTAAADDALAAGARRRGAVRRAAGRQGRAPA